MRKTRYTAAFVLLVCTLLIVMAAMAKPTFKAVHDREEITCRQVYTNSRGQSICIVYLPDSVYRK